MVLNESNTNYGCSAILWDRVFGTFRDPITSPQPAKTGVLGDPLPRGFIDQIIYPFRPSVLFGA